MTPAPANPVGVPHVLVAINAVKAWAAREGLAKTRTNESGAKFRFRGIDEVMNALASVMAENDLITLPRYKSRECEVRKTNSGGSIYNVVLHGELHFISARDGTREVAEIFGEAMDSGDKATNKAMSVIFKYSTVQTFCIPVEGTGDEDADATTHPPTTPEPKRAAPQSNLKPVADGRSRAATTRTFDEDRRAETDRAKANYAAPPPQAAPATPPGGDDDFPGDRPSKSAPPPAAAKTAPKSRGPVQHLKPDPKAAQAALMKDRSQKLTDKLMHGDQNMWGLQKMMTKLATNPQDPVVLEEVKAEYEEWKRYAAQFRDGITEQADKDRLNEGRQIFKDAMDTHMDPMGEFTSQPGMSDDDAAEAFQRQMSDAFPGGTFRDSADGRR